MIERRSSFVLEGASTKLVDDLAKAAAAARARRDPRSCRIRAPLLVHRRRSRSRRGGLNRRRCVIYVSEVPAFTPDLKAKHNPSIRPPSVPEDPVTGGKTGFDRARTAPGSSAGPRAARAQNQTSAHACAETQALRDQSLRSSARAARARAQPRLKRALQNDATAPAHTNRANG